MIVFQAEHNILMHPVHMLGVAGVFGGSLFSAMHGSLVTSSLIRETTENESANEGYRFGLIAPNQFFRIGFFLLLLALLSSPKMALQNKEEEKKKVKKLQKSYFDVLGICCTSEVPIIENILKSLDGVKEYSVIVPSRTVIVVHDSLLISPFQIAKALNEARLEANVRVNGETSFKNKWPSPFAVVSGLLLLLSFLKFVYSPLRWLAVAAVAAGIYPILAKAFASIKRPRIDINILVIITVIATLAMQDFMEAAAVVFLFTISDWLETRASYKATSVMQSLMSLAPQKAIIAETGEEVEVDEVKVDTVVAVKAGETIPIDGIVVDGNCEVDEKTLTGEAFPVPKQRDSTVWAGTINLNGM
jgi:Cd2+/Zn2+-exporting ATPase